MPEAGKDRRIHSVRHRMLHPMVAVSVVVCALSAPALADPVGMKGWVDAEGAHVRLAWPRAVKVESATEGRELLLRFSQPVEGDPVPAVVDQLPDWLEAASAGYDTILLRARQDVIWTVVSADADVTVNLVAVSRAGTAAPAPLDLRLGVQRARLLAGTGKADEARTVLADLASRYPDNREVIAAQAEIEARAGRRSTALALLQKGLGQYPNDPALTRARRDVLGAEGPNATIGGEYVSERNDSRYVSAVAGVSAVPVAEGVTVGAEAETRRISANDVVASDGTVADFDGSRQRGSAWVEAEVADETKLRLTAYGATNTLGGGADLRMVVGEGEANVGVAYHKTYWETAEAMRNNGTVDTVTAGYVTNWSEWLNLTLQLRGNRYAQDGIDLVGASGGGLLEARVVPVDDVPQFRVVYGVDAEYFGHKITRRDASGTEYVPLGLRSFEYHHAGIELTEEELLVPELFGTLFAGYGIDRLGGDGAYYGVEGGYRLTPQTSMQVHAGRNHVTTNGPQSVTTKAGANLRLLF